MGRKVEQQTRKVSRSERKARAEMQEATVAKTTTPEQIAEASETESTETTAPASKQPKGKQPKPTKTPEQIAEEARKRAEERAERIKAKADEKEAELRKQYPHVIEVTEYGSQGPKRVKISCTEPMTKQGPDGKPVSVCEGTRDIAVQDLFQVRQCAACAERKVRLARRARAKDRLKEAKALLAASRK